MVKQTLNYEAPSMEVIRLMFKESVLSGSDHTTLNGNDGEDTSDGGDLGDGND